MALVEFGLVLPLLMLIVLGLLDFGQAFLISIDERHLARQAARFAAVNSAPSPPCTGCLENQIEAQADIQELRNTIDVCVYLPPGSGGAIGDEVRVKVHGKHKFLNLIAPFIPGIDAALNKRITSEVSMRLEQPYTGSNTYTDHPSDCPNPP